MWRRINPTRVRQSWAIALAGPKALVFSQYLEEGVNFIADRFARYEPGVITGGVTGRKREEVVERFQNDDACKLFVATPKAGGIGLNLVAGNYVFHFDHWWNPATARQAEDRVHRIGQTKDVFVYHFWTEATVEERIYSIIDRKQQLYTDVIEELSNIQSTGLSEDELFELFDLKSPKRQERDKGGPAADQPILDRLIELTPDEFESTVARLYRALGFGTRIRASSRDGGVDILASRTTAAAGVESCAIQCKRYAPESPVGRPDAQKLLGVIAGDRSFTKGILITTSDFTSECRQFATGQANLQLVDGSTLVRLIRQTKLELT